MNEELKSKAESELNAPLQSKASLLKQLSSRITFGVGALVGALISMILEEPMAVGVLFGGAMALTLTTIFAPNKAFKERFVLGGAMLLFVVIALVAYLVY